MEETERDVARGRQQVWAATISVIGSVVLVAVLTRSVGSPLFMSLVLLGLLSFQTLRGRGWARWLLVALLVVWSGALGVAAANGDAPAWISFPLSVVYVACAAVLAFSPPVRRFVDAQRRREP